MATILVCRPPKAPAEPTRGAVLARRYVCDLGSAETLALQVKQKLRDAGWESIPIAEV